MAVRKKRPVKIQILFLLCFFLVMELSSRAYYSIKGIPFWGISIENVSQLYNDKHPYLPTVFKKNVRLRRRDDIVINNVGFRGPDLSLPKPQGSLRIAAFGGSTTWGNAVRDEDSWPRITEARLRKIFSKKHIEVINAGVPGYNSMEDLICLITRVLFLDPDIVLVYQGYNDMKAISRATTFEPDYSDWRTRIDPHSTFKNTLINHSRFLFGLDRLAKKIAKKKDVNTSEKNFKDYGQLAAFKRNILNIVAICRGHNIIPIISTLNLALDSKFIYQKSSIDIKPSEFKVILEAYNKQIRDIAVQNKAELVDAEKALADDQSIHSDICHFTVTGNEQLADLFVNKIVDILSER